MNKIASMGLQTTLQIVLAGMCTIFGLAQPITTAKSAFSPQSGDELKSAVDTCLNAVENMTINDSDTDNAKGSFTFVLIPASTNQPLTEVQKPKSSRPEDDEVKKYAKNYFIINYKKKDGRLNRHELDYSRPANNFTHVIMYSYKYAQPKKMPANKRASALASACMNIKTKIFGDTFLTRYFDKEIHWSSYNMLKSEVDKEAAWVVQAAKFNAIVKERKVRRDVTGNPNSEINVNGTEGPVSWNQTKEAVGIFIDLPTGVKRRNINVIVENNMVKFGLKLGYSFDESNVKGQPITLLRRLLTGLLQPYLPIIPKLSSWSMADGQFVIILTKRHPGYWSNLYK